MEVLKFVFVNDLPFNPIDRNLWVVFSLGVVLCLHHALDADNAPTIYMNGQTYLGAKAVMPNEIIEEESKCECGK